MKRKIQNVVIFFMIILLPGCVILSGPTGQGLIGTNLKAPVLVADNNVPSQENLKIGQARCINLFGLFAFGDCSINKAIENGKISKIHYIDKELNSFLFIASESTTIIYGE